MSSSNPNPAAFGAIEKVIDPLVILIRNNLDVDWFRANEKFLGRIGNYAAIIVAISFLLFGLVNAVKTDSFYFFIIGIGAPICTILIQYVSIKFVVPTIRSVENMETAISDGRVLDVFSFVVFVAGLAALFSGLFFWIKTEDISPFLIGLGVFFLAEYSSCLYANKALLSISEVATNKPSEDAICILSSLFKVSARLVVVAYGSWLIIGALGVLKTMYDMLSTEHFDMASLGSLWLFLSGLTYPIVAYFTFVFSMVGLDIITAILGMPQRLEAIARVIRTTHKSQ